MMCCFPTGIPDHASPQADKLFRIIKILAIVQVCFGIFSLFIDIWSGLLLLIGSLILFLVSWTKNWCTCVFYIILTLMDMLTTIVVVGNYFSQYEDLEQAYQILIVFYMLKIPFYFISIYYTFLGYRELKGLFVEVLNQGGLPPNYGALGGNQPAQQPRQAEAPQEPRFTGRGYRLDD